MKRTKYRVELFVPQDVLQDISDPTVYHFKAKSKKHAERKARRRERHYIGRRFGVAVYKED